VVIDTLHHFVRLRCYEHLDLNALKKHGLAPEFLAAHAVEFPEAVAACRAFVDDRTLVAHGMENKNQGRST